MKLEHASIIRSGIVTEARNVFVEGHLILRPVVRGGVAGGWARARPDSFGVDADRNAMRAFVDGGVDILLANEDEEKAFYGATGFGEALDRARSNVPVAVLTRSEKGR